MVFVIKNASNSAVISGGPGLGLGWNNTLFIQQDGFAITSSPTNFGINLTSRAAAGTIADIWIDGTVFGGDAGLRVFNGQPGHAYVTVGSTGSISGSQTAIQLDAGIQTSAVSLENHGRISSTTRSQATIFSVFTQLELNNTGLISSHGGPAILAANGTTRAHITNSGRIEGRIELSGAAGQDAALVNSGSIDGNILILNGGARLENSGTIHGAINISTSETAGFLLLLNEGHITGQVTLISGFASTLDLTGATLDRGLAITSAETVSYLGFDGARIGGSLSLGDANKTVDLSGMTVGRLFYSGAGDDDLTFHSGLVHGGFNTGLGNDALDMQGGQVNGLIQLGFGDDTLLAGDGAERVVESFGDDLSDLGGGNDIYRVGGAEDDGNDSTDGGAGIDTISLVEVDDGYDFYTATTGGVLVDLDEGILRGRETNSDNLFGFDLISNFENVIGGAFDDMIFGSAGDNQLAGGNGADQIYGLAGNDTLRGGQGDDTLQGDEGRDVMTGGAGNDVFVFQGPGDGSTQYNARDIILDFTKGQDKIDLHTFDARPALDGVQGFSFAGQGGTSAVGSIRYVYDHGDTLVQLNTAGGNAAEFTLLLQGRLVLTAADFLL